MICYNFFNNRFIKGSSVKIRHSYLYCNWWRRLKLCFFIKGVLVTAKHEKFAGRLKRRLNHKSGDLIKRGDTLGNVSILKMSLGKGDIDRISLLFKPYHVIFWYDKDKVFYYRFNIKAYNEYSPLACHVGLKKIP